MELKRKVYEQLGRWKQRNGKTALLIEGARRVGKSYAAKHFGDAAYKSCISIDFANIRKEVIDLFENEFDDLDLFFNKLSVITDVKLYRRESLFIFDEVQQYPKARQLIKYLVADGRYDYIETGSLISLRRNIQNIVIPSEEEHIILNPLDFEEFLWAMGDETLYPFIEDCFKNRQPVGDAIHRRALNMFRQYMLVGGMPQAVTEYVETKSFEQTDYVKRMILRLYLDDVTKFAGGYESKVLAIFDELPAQLSKHEKKFMLSSINKAARFREYEDAFMWLDEAKIINICFNNTDPNVGLGLNQDRMRLKCYMADTGLLFSHAFSDKELTEEAVYKAILFDRMGLNEGMFLENIVAQMLTAKGDHLYFYSRNDKMKTKNNMEIDFLIRRKKKICPLEVKSSNYKAHISLDRFIEKYNSKISEKYIIYTKDLKKEQDIIYIPVYMTGCL